MLNVEKLVFAGVFSPVAKIGKDIIPLYSRVEGTTKGLNSYEILLAQDKKLAAIREKNFNSPGNIRCLFLCRDGVVVEFYKGYYKSGKPQNLSVVSKFSEEEQSEVLGGFRKLVEQGDLNTKGSVLKVLNKHWVLSNIEEIYVDFSLLLTLDTLPYLRGSAVTDGFISSYLGNSMSSGIVKGDYPLKAVNLALGLKDGELEGKFSRLVGVGVFSNLTVDAASKCKDVRKGLDERVRKDIDFGRRDLLLNQAVNSGVNLGSGMVYVTKNFYKPNGKLVSKGGIYLFDRVVMDDYAEKFERDFSEYLKEIEVEKTSQAADEDTSEVDEIEIDEDEGVDVEVGGDEQGFETDSAVEVEIDVEDGDTLDTESKIKGLKLAWGSSIDAVVANILRVYDNLYEPGYALIKPQGLLTEAGILSCNSKGDVGYVGDRALDIPIFLAIDREAGGVFSKIEKPEKEVDIEGLMQGSGSGIMSGLHLKAMFGYFNLKIMGEAVNVKLPSLRSHLKAKGIGIKGDGGSFKEVNENTNRIVKWKYLRGYLKEILELIFYSAYIQMGVTNDVNQGTINLTTSINKVLSSSLKTVLVVTEKKKGVNTRIKVSSDMNLDPSKLIKALEKDLNIGSAGNVKVVQIGAVESGVIDLQVIYNVKGYYTDSLFAHEVLDILAEQGIKPSWDNVVLGKQEDGSIMTYNFKNPNNFIYALYAGSGSGKGVMTLNLLVSALVDGCKVLYTDAKPDVSKTLANVVWQRGLDCYVFNGVDAESPLELMDNCVREGKRDRFSSRQQLPPNVFESEAEQEDFMLVVSYLRSLELISKMAKARMDKCSMDDWIVGVFDECEQLSVMEEKVCDGLARAMKKRKSAIDPEDPKGKRKINITRDRAAIFIEDFLAYRDKVRAEFMIGIKSAFRKANMTMFFVWQSSAYPQKLAGKSTLADILIGARAKIIKIIGKGGVEQGGSTDFGNGTTLPNMSWYDTRFTGEYGGYFGIGGKITTGMKVFRPFNVFSNDKGLDMILTNAKACGRTPEDLIGSQLNEDGTVIHEVGFEGYATKLLGLFGKDLAVELSKAITYTDDFVVREKLAGDTLEFIYNAHNFNKARPVNEDEDGGQSGDMLKLGSLGRLDDSSDSGSTNEGAGKGQSSANVESNELPSTVMEVAAALGSEMRQTPSGLTVSVDTSEIEGSNIVEVSEEQDYELNDDGEVVGGEVRQVYRVVPPAIQSRSTNPMAIKQGVGSTECVVENLESANAQKIDEKQSIIATFKGSDDAESRMFSQLWGTQSVFKSRWKAVLKGVASKIRPEMVTRVLLTDNDVFVNGKRVYMQGIIGGIEDVRLVDIVDFKMLFAEYPNLKELELDANMLTVLSEIEMEKVKGARYDSPLAYAFSINKHLSIIKYVAGNEVRGVYTRNDVLGGNVSSQGTGLMDSLKLRRQMDVVGSVAGGTRERRAGEVNRVWAATKSYTGEAWSNVGKSLVSENPSFIGAAKAGVAGLLLLGVGSVISVPSAIFGGFKRLFK